MNQIPTIYLNRLRQSDQGTEGILSVPGFHFSCPSLELPWRDNRPQVSCIPPGTYPLAWRISNRWQAFHIQNVPDRSFVLIHSGNFAGDVSKGWQTHVQGCVLLGIRFGWIKGQRAILASRPMVRRFNDLMKGLTAQIIIQEAWQQPLKEAS